MLQVATDKSLTCAVSQLNRPLTLYLWFQKNKEKQDFKSQEWFHMLLPSFFLYSLFDNSYHRKPPCFFCVLTDQRQITAIVSSSSQLPLVKLATSEGRVLFMFYPFIYHQLCFDFSFQLQTWSNSPWPWSSRVVECFHFCCRPVSTNESPW